MTAYRPLAILAASLLCLALPSADAANYVFDVNYLGNNNATLAPGSDDPDNLVLDPGDTFQWTIEAASDRFWLVDLS